MGSVIRTCALAGFTLLFVSLPANPLAANNSFLVEKLKSPKATSTLSFFSR
jgi:hypothetical protein